MHAQWQHFLHVMQSVLRRLSEQTGTVDTLNVIARELAAEVKVLCFDELFINDIGDASILGRLFITLFDEGLVLVLTSNIPPERLYEHGHNRERLLPALMPSRSPSKGSMWTAGQTNARP